jgi:NAD-dependent SIR2 family protein deacetylase
MDTGRERRVLETHSLARVAKNAIDAPLGRSLGSRRLPIMATEASNRNVFILGAGFSASAGAPVIRDFLARSREFYDDPSSGLDPEERERFSRVFKFRRDMAQAREKVRIDLDDIEQLFGLVEISQRLEKTSQETRNDTVYLIAKTLELATKSVRFRRRVGFSTNVEILDKITPLPDLFRQQPAMVPPFFQVDMYDYVAGLVGGLLEDPDRRQSRNDAVITFNYDLVLDDALRRIGIEPEYHIPPQFLSAKENTTPRGTFSVLKLHGSTNWGVCAKCNDTVVVLPSKVTASPAEFRALRCWKCHAQKYHPLLIPPSWDKSEYGRIMQSVWKKAVEELISATRICIVGYSMPETDAFFKYLLTLALSENHQLYKLIVVDLSEELEARYESLLDELFRKRKFSFHRNGLENFLASQGACAELGRGEVVGGSISLY